MTQTSVLAILTIDETCSALRLSKTTVHRLFRARRLRTVRVGSRRFVRIAEIERFLKASEER